MIDVIFLLLVFFMLAARFGAEDSLPLQTATTTGGSYSGPPRLIDVGAQELRLNGRVVLATDLVAALAPLTLSPTDAIVLRPEQGAPLQALLRVMDDLRAAGFVTLVLVE
jgi:biopolymer transport protein ExbD